MNGYPFSRISAGEWADRVLANSNGDREEARRGIKVLLRQAERNDVLTMKRFFKAALQHLAQCLRCGRRIPARRRTVSDYCTERCARRQAWEDEESARTEREQVAADRSSDEC